MPKVLVLIMSIIYHAKQYHS